MNVPQTRDWVIIIVGMILIVGFVLGIVYALTMPNAPES